MIKSILLFLLFALSATGSFCQHYLPGKTPMKVDAPASMQRTHQPGLDFPDYPPLTMTETSRNIELPAVVDNSQQPYLRAVFGQNGAACGQSASVAYNFCYEINRLRQQPSDTTTRTYPDHFTYNFMNATEPYYGQGVSYFHTFDILYDAGCPTESDYGPVSLDDNYFWMSGYEKYYNAMHNRLNGIRSIAVNTPEGLNILKQWLHNHLEGSPVGGVANFYAGLYIAHQLPGGTPEGGKYVETQFYETASHAMTIVGYNDSIRYDRNNDGIYTNDLDITGDGLVDMKDWEIGGLKFVNSYDEYWANEGFSYMLYSTLAVKYGEGGIWNNAVHVVIPEANYIPQLTIKTRIKHNTRGRIKLMAGISTDAAARFPEHTMEFSIFNFQGGDFYMTGSQHEKDKSLETGLDITRLLSYMKPGEPARFFLLVQENDSTSMGSGRIESFSVIRYNNGEVVEYSGNETPCEMIDNGLTVVSVLTDFTFSSPAVSPETLSWPEPGNPQQVQLSGINGVEPYSWQLLYDYIEIQSNRVLEPINVDTLYIGNPYTNFARVALPFSFPYMGSSYDTLSMHRNGYLMFDKQDMPFTYLLYDESYLKQLRCIAPYMNLNLDINHEGEGLFYSADSSHAVFKWKLSSAGEEGSVVFLTTLFPDGRISFQYGPNTLNNRYQPVIGLGSGTAAGSIFSRKSGQRLTQAETIVFHPETSFTGLTLSSNGLLSSSTPISDSASGSITVQLTEARHIPATKKYILGSLPEIELISGSLLTPGAQCDINASIHCKDAGAELDLRLVSLSPFISISDSLLTGITVEAGETLTIPAAFTIEVNNSVNKNQMAACKLVISDGSRITARYINFQIDIPEVVAFPPFFNDGNNGQADPGEELEMVFRISNYSKAPAGFITAIVSTSDPLIAINGPSIRLVGDLKGTSSLEVSFPLIINEVCGHGRKSSVQLELWGPDNLVLAESFPFVIGEPTILVIDMDGNVNSAKHIRASVAQWDIESIPLKVIDSTLLEYDIVFLSLGITPYNHKITQPESDLLESLLNSGGNLYLECGSFFKQDPYVPLRDRFRVEGSTQAWPHPADTLLGEAGTPVEGIHIDYRGDWVKAENLLILEPAQAWFTDINSGFHFVAVNDSIHYRTIASTVEFGGTFPYSGPGRKEMMSSYLNFMGYPTQVLAANFRANDETICPGNLVSYEPFCMGEPLSYHWTFEGGTPDSWDGEFPQIKYNTPGQYGAELTISDASGHQNTLTRENIIVVEECLSNSEHQVISLKIWPNPAKDQFRVHLGVSPHEAGWITLSSMQGQIAMQLKVAQGVESLTISTERLKSGIYLVSFSTQNVRSMGKVVVL